MEKLTGKLPNLCKNSIKRLIPGQIHLSHFMIMVLELVYADGVIQQTVVLAIPDLYVRKIALLMQEHAKWPPHIFDARCAILSPLKVKF